jgi:hypothetical protein
MDIKVKQWRENSDYHRMIHIPTGDWEAATPEQKATLAFVYTSRSESPLNPGDLIFDEKLGTVLLKNRGIRILDYSDYCKYIKDAKKGLMEYWLK